MNVCCCYNMDGSPIHNVYQWDTNRHIVVKDLPFGTDQSSVFIKFTNVKMTCSISVEPIRETNKYTAMIPNELLAEPYDIIVCIYVGDINYVRQTVGKIIIPLVRRDMAEDKQYVSPSGCVFADGLAVVDDTMYLTRSGKILGTGADLKDVF